MIKFILSLAFIFSGVFTVAADFSKDPNMIKVEVSDTDTEAAQQDGPCACNKMKYPHSRGSSEDTGLLDEDVDDDNEDGNV